MLRILLIEDNPADAHMLQTSLVKTGMPVEINRLEDGEKAIEYFALSDKRTLATLGCDIVLLDLNLPRVGGYEVLEYIRSRNELKSLPVIIMSGSRDPEEIDRCYEAGANSYICKPTNLDEILSTAASFLAYWSHCVKLPSRRFAPRPLAAAQSK
jgi:two-component system response regulator